MLRQGRCRPAGLLFHAPPSSVPSGCTSRPTSKRTSTKTSTASAPVTRPGPPAAASGPAASPPAATPPSPAAAPAPLPASLELLHSLVMPPPPLLLLLHVAVAVGAGAGPSSQVSSTLKSRAKRPSRALKKGEPGRRHARDLRGPRTGYTAHVDTPLEWEAGPGWPCASMSARPTEGAAGPLGRSRSCRIELRCCCTEACAALPRIFGRGSLHSPAASVPSPAAGAAAAPAPDHHCSGLFVLAHLHLYLWFHPHVEELQAASTAAQRGRQLRGGAGSPPGYAAHGRALVGAGGERGMRVHEQGPACQGREDIMRPRHAKQCPEQHG